MSSNLSVGSEVVDAAVAAVVLNVSLFVWDMISSHEVVRLPSGNLNLEFG